eukprot:SAG31_NODE_3825_length_3848_cov_1.551614_6_plen_66_part_01
MQHLNGSYLLMAASVRQLDPDFICTPRAAEMAVEAIQFAANASAFKIPTTRAPEASHTGDDVAADV